MTWTFSDPGPGDSQGAYQLKIARASDLQLALDTGKVAGSSTQYNVPTSGSPNVPGPLWASGDYRFKVRVKVWDQAGVESDWSDWADFCVVAFERPRKARIVSPPPEQAEPKLDDPATHILIHPGAIASDLKVKAGAKVTLLVDSVGPVSNATASFPYGSGQQATVGTLPSVVVTNGVNQTWKVEFWTDPRLQVTPEDTVVKMNLNERQRQCRRGDINAPLYAEGVVVTQGSIYNDWFVVLQGRDN